jgi:hypothetical protein
MLIVFMTHNSHRSCLLEIDVKEFRGNRLRIGLFLKKAENQAHAVSLFFLYYNYCRPHQTLTRDAGGVKTTPAMASGLADGVWAV